MKQVQYYMLPLISKHILERNDPGRVDQQHTIKQTTSGDGLPIAQKLVAGPAHRPTRSARGICRPVRGHHTPPPSGGIPRNLETQEPRNSVFQMAFGQLHQHDLA